MFTTPPPKAAADALARRLEMLLRLREDIQTAPMDASTLLATMRELLNMSFDTGRLTHLAEVDNEIAQVKAELIAIDQTRRAVGGTEVPGCGTISM